MGFAGFMGMMGGAGGGAGAGGMMGGGGGGMMGSMGKMMGMVMKPVTELLGAMSKSKFAKNIKYVDKIVGKISKGDFMGAIVGFMEMTGVIDMLTMAIEPLLVLLDPVRALFQIMGSSIAEELYPIMTELIPMIMALSPQFKDLGKVIGEFIGDFLTSDFVPLFEKFVELLPSLLEYAIEFTGLALDLIDMMVKIPKDVMNDLISASIDFIEFIVDNKDTLIGMMEKVQAVLGVIIEGYEAFQSMSDLSFGKFEVFQVMVDKLLDIGDTLRDLSDYGEDIEDLLDDISGFTGDTKGYLRKLTRGLL